MMQLSIKIRGDVTSSNFEIWKQDLLQKIDGIDSVLTNDAQFARAQEEVKAFKSAEKALKSAKEIAIQQVSAIHTLFSAIDEISAQARQARLSLERQIRGKKEKIKRDFVDLGLDTIRKYLSVQPPAFQKIDHSSYFSRSLFADAIKGKATFNTLSAAVSKKCDEIQRLIDSRVKEVIENQKKIHALPIDHQNLIQDHKVLLALSAIDLDRVISDRIAVYQRSHPSLGGALGSKITSSLDPEQNDTAKNSHTATQDAFAGEITLSRTEAVTILRALLEGFDPHTGEILASSSSLKNPKVVAAISLAIVELEKQAQTKVCRSKPNMAGEKWTTEEEERLISAFKDGLSLMELAQLHMRTRGAISSRLGRMGLTAVPLTRNLSEQGNHGITEAGQNPHQNSEATAFPPQVLLDGIISTCLKSAEDEILSCVASSMERVCHVADDKALGLSNEDFYKVLKINEFVLAAEEFKLALQDIPYAIDQTVTDELVAWLQETAAPLDQASILFQRIDKEIRTLLEGRSKLPTGAKRQISQPLIVAHRKLLEQAPICGNRGCQQKMTLREGKYGLFWGCTNYPNCCGAMNLSKEQLGLLPD